MVPTQTTSASVFRRMRMSYLVVEAQLLHLGTDAILFVQKTGPLTDQQVSLGSAQVRTHLYETGSSWVGSAAREVPFIQLLSVTRRPLPVGVETCKLFLVPEELRSGSEPEPPAL